MRKKISRLATITALAPCCIYSRKLLNLLKSLLAAFLPLSVDHTLSRRTSAPQFEEVEEKRGEEEEEGVSVCALYF